jgi:hypothetical protein
MSGHQAKPKKRTVAQVRRETDQFIQALKLGIQLADSSKAGLAQMLSVSATREERHDQATALLNQAIRACELLQYHPDPAEHARALCTKGNICIQLAYHSLTMSTFQQADEA